MSLACTICEISFIYENLNGSYVSEHSLFGVYHHAVISLYIKFVEFLKIGKAMKNLEKWICLG